MNELASPNEMLVGISGIGAAVMALTELVGRGLKPVAARFDKKWLCNKSLIAVMLGTTAGVIAHGSGSIVMGVGGWGWAMAIWMGLLSTAGAIAGHQTAKKATGGKV